MPKLLFPEGMGGIQKSSKNAEGVGGVGWGYFSGQKMEIPGRRMGLREILSVVGVLIDIFWNYTLRKCTKENKLDMTK